MRARPRQVRVPSPPHLTDPDIDTLATAPRIPIASPAYARPRSALGPPGERRRERGGESVENCIAAKLKRVRSEVLSGRAPSEGRGEGRRRRAKMQQMMQIKNPFSSNIPADWTRKHWALVKDNKDDDFPIVVADCVKHIEEHGTESGNRGPPLRALPGINVEGIMRISGSQTRIQELKRGYDRGSSPPLPLVRARSDTPHREGHARLHGRADPQRRRPAKELLQGLERAAARQLQV